MKDNTRQNIETAELIISALIDAHGYAAQEIHVSHGKGSSAYAGHQAMRVALKQAHDRLCAARATLKDQGR